MSLHIIELNDRNVRISDAESVLGSSPGFVNIAHSAPIFGEDARQQSRLHPRQSYNQFWSQLSLDALVNSNNHFRHQADLAYAHLSELAARYNINGDVIFAVPSNYNRDQLAILLGLVKQCPFNAVGLVDLAVLHAANNSSSNIDPQQPAVFVDIQLHQTVLTMLDNTNGKLSRGKVLQIPGTGILALYDAWTNMITDEFIKQSRFDPQHNADTEQYVYIQLSQWLIDTIKGNEVLLEINNKGAVHQAKVNLGHFEQKARTIISRIQNEIQTLAASNSQIYLPEAMASLPGLSLYLADVLALDNAAPVDNCFANLAHLTSEPGALSLVTTMPVGSGFSSGFSSGSGSASTETSTPEQESAASQQPSHFLLNHQAFVLPASIQHLGVSEQGLIEATDSSDGAVLTIMRQSQELILQTDSATASFQPSLNGVAIKTASPVQLGDIVSFANSASTLQFIQVM